ncbi:MAG: hypothetical protein KatS3mg111_2176 [Pirellulaceae bacterium]|nr:MAG: hypothetical protein KatS3mg111_2176 [Pirellulaceae bacterium]
MARPLEAGQDEPSCWPAVQDSPRSNLSPTALCLEPPMAGVVPAAIGRQRRGPLPRGRSELREMAQPQRLAADFAIATVVSPAATTGSLSTNRAAPLYQAEAGAVLRFSLL